MTSSSLAKSAKKTAVILLIAVVLASCTGGELTAPQPGSTHQAGTPSAALPEKTEVPTSLPTATPAATVAPAITAGPSPTETPVPPPTISPESIASVTLLDVLEAGDSALTQVSFSADSTLVGPLPPTGSCTSGPPRMEASCE